MKFKIREGFIAYDRKVQELANGEKVEVVNPYVGGMEADFDEPTALEHLHKLEPVSKDAKAFLDGRAAPALQVGPGGVVLTPPAPAAAA